MYRSIDVVSQPSLKDQYMRLTDKMQHEIQVVKKQMRVKNLKMFRAKQKLRIIQNEQEYMRDTLREKISQKLKQTQSNLQNLITSKNSKSKSKQKLRQTTLSRIKLKQKTTIEQNFRKSQQLRKDSEQFLKDRKLSQSRSRIVSSLQSPEKTRYVQDESTMYGSLVVFEERKKILPSVLRATDSDIKKRQSRKSQQQQNKDAKNLHEYIQKLNNIEARRQNRSDRLSEAVKLIEKERKKQQQRYESKKKANSINEKQRTMNSYSSATKQAIKNKYSFSQMYTKKLQQKLSRKAYFEGQSIRSGDMIMQKSRVEKRNSKNNRLLNETLLEVQRKINFKNMECFRK